MLGTILKLCEQTSQRSTVSDKQLMQMVTAKAMIPGMFKIVVFFIKASTIPVTTTNEPIIPNTNEPIKVSVEIAIFEKNTLNSNDPNISSGFQVTIFMDNSNSSEDIRINYVTVEIPGTDQIKTIHNFSNPDTENMSFLVFRNNDNISLWPIKSRKSVQPGPSGQSVQPGQSLLKPILHPNNLDTSCTHETTRMYVQSQTPIDMPSRSYIFPNAIKSNTIICKRCLSMSQRSDATRRPKKQRVTAAETVTSNNVTMTSHSSNLHSLPASTPTEPTIFDMSLNSDEHIDINNRTIMGHSENTHSVPLTTQSVPIIFDSPLNIVEERNIGSTWQLDDPGESVVWLNDSFTDDSNYALYLTEDDKYDSFAEQLND
ncbi:PREDICTED: uncharacterized protein LOC106104447 [Papilio polytes]|uniref:uncharacterized protein LOC106104447 n=1 Tax=Papilio polytes TaxID=76194 RepID=UPI000675E771|nr:PREDICTED: uncharacterized protein LOC106104447 [Papilio polytes]